MNSICQSVDDMIKAFKFNQMKGEIMHLAHIYMIPTSRSHIKNPHLSENEV